MQYSQPFCGTGFLNNFGQTYPCNFAFPQAAQPYPQIIGEGEVASVVFPDGSIHLYFIPLQKRFPPYNYHPNQNYTTFCDNTMGAYYVRGISNPITPALFSQQCQRNYSGPYPRSCYISECDINLPSPGFQLKFHNDCCTSTTDLQYFFPRVRQCEWFPSTRLTGCASVQVDIPVKDCCEVVECSKPCLCEGKYCSGCESTDECLPGEQKDSKKTNLKNKTAKVKQKKLDKTKSVVCKCREARTTDRSTATVAEQGSCAAERERNTQTSRPGCAKTTSISGVGHCPNKTNVTTELWIPNTSKSAKTMKRKSSHKLIGIYETGSSGTCCCSSTEGD